MWYQKLEEEAAQRVEAALRLPIPDVDSTGMNCMSDGEYFDPWSLFPSIYGTYSSEFDNLALDVLRDICARKFTRSDLASEIFREMLCRLYLCDYGSSPRVCFATTSFEKVLPSFIEKWEGYAERVWKSD